MITKTVEATTLHKIGPNACARREELGISQKEAATKLGISVQELNEFELGRGKLSPNVILDIAVLLHTTYIKLSRRKS